MGEIKYLYHYTSLIHWENIKKSGYLKLTPSNLMKPKHPHMVKIEGGYYACVDEETDNIKPVVWLTESEDPTTVGNTFRKDEVKIAIPYNEQKHLWWVEWKDKNRMNKSWFKKLTSHGERYGLWYVCEDIIPIEEFEYVKNLKTGEDLYLRKEG